MLSRTAVLRCLANLPAVLILLAAFFPVTLPAALTPEQRKANLESFDHVWNTVREHHWDQSVPGLDWDAVRDELRPKVEKAESESEARDLLSGMLARLHLTHFAVIPGTVYKDVAMDRPATPVKEPTTGDTIAPPSSEDGTAGIDLRILDHQAVVVSVEPASSAARQGVKPGWIIRRIDDEDLAPVIKRVAATYAHSTEEELFLTRTILSRLEGPLANTVAVEFADAHDKPFALTLERQPFRGEPAHFGYLPEEHLWISSRRIPPDTPYIAFNLFLDPPKLIPAFQDFIRDCPDCPGVVVDLRGNPGGLAILASGLAGFFIATPIPG